MGGRFDLKVSARDTGGDLCIYDTVRGSKVGPRYIVIIFKTNGFILFAAISSFRSVIRRWSLVLVTPLSRRARFRMHLPC